MSAGSKFNLLGIQKLFLWNLVPIIDEIKNVSKQTTIRVEGEDHLLTLFVVLNLVIAERLYKHKTYFQFVGWQNELQKLAEVVAGIFRKTENCSKPFFWRLILLQSCFFL